MSGKVHLKLDVIFYGNFIPQRNAKKLTFISYNYNVIN